MNVVGIKTSLFKESDSLVEFIKQHISSLHEGDILAITSKIVSLSEHRTGNLSDKRSLILKEAKQALETPWALLTLTADGWGINAGIDESNAQNKIILLPKDSFKTAGVLHEILKKYFALKKLGILITDTRSIPLRVGTVGRAIGYAGFAPLKSYIDKKDLFGRKSRVTTSNQADALAAAAVLVMGEGDEQSPLAIIQKAPIVFTFRYLSQKSKSLALSPKKDIFSKIYNLVAPESRKLSKRK